MLFIYTFSDLLVITLQGFLGNALFSNNPFILLRKNFNCNSFSFYI